MTDSNDNMDSRYLSMVGQYDSLLVTSRRVLGKDETPYPHVAFKM